MINHNKYTFISNKHMKSVRINKLSLESNHIVIKAYNHIPCQGCPRHPCSDCSQWWFVVSASHPDVQLAPGVCCSEGGHFFPAAGCSSLLWWWLWMQTEMRRHLSPLSASVWGEAQVCLPWWSLPGPLSSSEAPGQVRRKWKNCHK